MEYPNRSKRRGFSKSKLIMSLYRVKQTPSDSSFNSQEFEPNAQPPPTAGGFIIVNQDQVFSKQKPDVVFAVADLNSYGKLENFYDDEAVDAKAAAYISSVQERFRLERVNSECNKLKNLQLDVVK